VVEERYARAVRIVALLDSSDFDDAVRLAISLGGDSDTQAAIAGGIAHAFYGAVPPNLESEVKARLPTEFVGIIDELASKYPARR
jgi:ADP-ribosylglycohydrolase